jgi:dTDP-D-glucose 4,6-dehydratase
LNLQQSRQQLGDRFWQRFVKLEDNEQNPRRHELTGNQAGLLYTDRRKWDTKSRLLASVDRARELLGYDPKTTFEDGLKTTIQWFKDNWEDISRDAEFPPGMSSAVKNYVLHQDAERE